MKILVADDDRGARTLLKGLLAKLGHTAVLAESGGDAWRLLAEEASRLVITDWNMPGMTGVELCQRVRARQDAPYTYVILVTVRDDLQSFTQGMAAGADDFLTKPIDIGLLAARIRVAERILGLQQEVTHLRAQQLPVCIYCKRLHTEGGAWITTEEYLALQPGLELTDRICPDCYRSQLAPEVADLEKD